VKVGLDIYTLHAQRPTAREALQLVLDKRLQGIQFGNPRQISPTLDAGELREVAEEFRRHGLYLELGLPSVNPHGAAALAHEAGGGATSDHFEGLIEALQAAAATGARVLRTVVGWEKDRYSQSVPWPQQLADVTAVLKRLAPIAREQGQRIGLESHCDITTHEMLRIIEAVGEDVVGVCLDTGNLPTRMDEPIAAARRVAPYVICTHTKDALLFTTERSLPAAEADQVDWGRARVTDGRGNSVDPRAVPPAIGWQSRPCGQGSVPFPEVIDILARHAPDLAFSIEDHGNIQTMPIYEPDWLASYPDLTTHELAQLVRLAHEGDRRIAAGEAPSPYTAEATPWPERTYQRIDQSAAYLTDLLRGKGLLAE
jgi:sugar phosphate isomerase/epimerase